MTWMKFLKAFSVSARFFRRRRNERAVAAALGPMALVSSRRASDRVRVVEIDFVVSVETVS